MKLNLERYKKVIAAIEDFAASDSKYTFDEFCREKNLYSDSDRKRIDGIFIVCPFHKDSSPSLSIDERHRRFKCFGCGAGKHYIDFITKYDTDVLGLSVTKAQKANEILNNDKEMQAKLGFRNIFQAELAKPAELQKLEFTRFKIKPSLPKTYLELSSGMVKRNAKLREIKFAVALMQRGIAPEIIAQQLSSLETTETVKKYSVKELEKE